MYNLWLITLLFYITVVLIHYVLVYKTEKTLKRVTNLNTNNDDSSVQSIIERVNINITQKRKTNINFFTIPLIILITIGLITGQHFMILEIICASIISISTINKIRFAFKVNGELKAIEELLVDITALTTKQQSQEP